MRKYILILRTVTAALMIMMAGCTYHLRYSVSAERGTTAPFKQRERSFTVEQRKVPGSREYRTEAELLEIVARSLADQGWHRVIGRDAAYVFQVEFGEEEYAPKIGFGAAFGNRSGFFLFGQLNANEGESRNQFIEIIAFENESERAYVWSADIRTSRVRQDLKLLASHTIPNALARFPQQGEWKVKEKVHLNRKEE
jgi:hypothetical protein